MLSGGGARAAYQIGVLTALAELHPSLTFPIFTGVSAGAINTLFLATHRGSFAEAVARLREHWSRLTVDEVFRVRPFRLGRAALRWLAQAAFGRGRGPTALRGLLDTTPLRQFLARHLDPGGVAHNLATGRLRAAALTATSFATGYTVTFVEGAPDVALWQRARRVGVAARLTIDHVMASSALPILFPAVNIGDVFYGDGSVRQTAPLSPAIHLGARALLAIGMRTSRTADPRPQARDYPSAAETMGMVLDSIFLDALDPDAERLARVNRLVAALPPGTRSPDGLSLVRLLMVHPSRDPADLAVGHLHTLPRGLRRVVESLGGRRVQAADFLSYLLFEPRYTTTLIDRGYDDARAARDRIARFLEPGVGDDRYALEPS
ncbi:MAG TPA: patatin-like phospholipase family protein [Gemmatimonadales bacterium]